MASAPDKEVMELQSSPTPPPDGWVGPTDDEWEVIKTRPWDLLDPRQPRTPKVIAEGRYDICKLCDEFHGFTHTCGICHCFMALKVHLAGASCPIGRWNPVEGVPS